MIETRYGVAIRSVRDNGFLRRTLASLRSQSVPPDDVVIAIPADVDPWEVDILPVRFVVAPRGMVTQRAAGIREARGRYALLLDDDIVLAPDAAERLLGSLVRNKADCAVPYWPMGYPKAGKTRRLHSFFGMAVPDAVGGISYNLGGGYRYPLREPPEQGWETAGGAGCVIAVDREFALSANETGDQDFQRISAFALRDDGALILSWRRHGGKCLMVPGIDFEHLGGTTRMDPHRKTMEFKTHVYNQLLFWRKYIRPSCRNRRELLVAQCALARYLSGVAFFALAAAISARSMHPIKGLAAGCLACRNIKSDGSDPRVKVG